LSSVTLSWTASTDDTKVTGYRIYRDGQQVGTSTGVSYSDTGLQPLTQYSYTVTAIDAAGNESPKSTAATATTTNATGTGQ